MWKKVISMVLILLCLASCGKKGESIEGYWMTEAGDTISFTSDGKAIIGGIGMSLNYSVYDENYLSISLLGFAEEYRFEIKRDVLTLTELGTGEVEVFYRDETKQTEIQERLSEVAIEQAERERIQQELEAQARAQEDYEKYVKSLKNRMESIDTEISWIYECISDTEGYIADEEAYIQEECDTINELENEISKLQYNTDDLAQGQVEVLRGRQEVCYGIIEIHNEQIETYRDRITQYKQEIADLEAEKEEIIKELKDLGEY